VGVVVVAVLGRMSAVRLVVLFQVSSFGSKKKRGASRTEAISFGLLPILVWALIWKFCCGLCVRDGLWHKFCLIIASVILVLHKKSITAEASSIAVISNGSPSP
jgi:hypothetical protein